ncbi:hypothetical protein Kisp01_48810 [Kineosporia sp. NBRC 101677]|uniref:hypothetical protein n=1 Tax=Kineosporia sp. NBRC 101677 TaxID=3032197 RepID=UPI0024A4B61F|nr:hypothetical protein [Kineosporia sp. NBRC 101677]GLY17867.1 hypothetical protein Kisp01_48810 [Kineosporia sp. NBRC 101677]
MSPTAPIRKNVPLDENLIHAVEAARTPGSTYNYALTHLAGHSAAKSEATTLTALVQLGVKALDEAVLEQAYVDMAAQRQEDADTISYQQALRARRRRSSTDD